MTLFPAGSIITAAAALAYGLILVLFPWLQRYALARPNARSSHSVPTPQGGGIAIIAAVIVVATVTLWWMQKATPGATVELAVVLAAATGLAIVGAADDILSLSVVPRMALQVVAVLAVVAALPADLRIISFLSWDFERALLLLFGVWFVNLTNFMDGLDWITVADTLPVAAAIAIFGAFTAVPTHAAVVALALLGATVGFAPFNRPVARLFLGDVGSLPLGLLLAWLLIELAGNGHLAAAILLPLYPCADATITLLRRAARGEKVWQAHRSHFYQVATNNGYSVPAIVGRVFATNVALAGLAAFTLWQPSRWLHAMAVLVGLVLVGVLLWRFSHPKRP